MIDPDVEREERERGGGRFFGDMECAWVGDESVSFELFLSRHFLVVFFEESKQRGVFTLSWHYFANRALCFYRLFLTLRVADKNIRSAPRPHFMRAY